MLPRVLAASLAILAASSGAALAQGEARPPLPAGIAPPAGFERGSVAHLASLCAAGPDNPNHSEAIGLCHGFLIGVGQYHAALHPRGSALPPVFCLPHPPPSLQQVTAAFVAWAKANPQYGSERAVEGVMRWAHSAYPCAEQPAPPPPRRSR
jgi:hypothetical protein